MIRDSPALGNYEISVKLSPPLSILEVKNQPCILSDKMKAIVSHHSKEKKKGEEKEKIVEERGEKELEVPFSARFILTRACSR